jgi:hypothetical protein
MKAIDRRLTELEAKWKSRPCKKPGHGRLVVLFLVTGPNGNEREIEEKKAEFRNCERCRDETQIVTFSERPAPVVTGWEGLATYH